MRLVLELLTPATLTLVFINSLLAWSFWLPLSAGQLSLISAGAAAIGGYTAAVLMLHGIPFLVALAAAGAAGAVAMALVGLFAIRLRGYSYALVTLGLSEVIRIAINNSESLGGPGGLVGIPTSELVYPAGGLCCLALAGFSWWLRRNRFGRYLDLVAQDELQARTLGVPIASTKVLVVTGQGLSAGLAGGLMAGYLGFLAPDQFGISLLTSVFAYVVLGGVASFVGPFLGAAFLTLALQYFANIGDIRYIGFGALLVLVILVRREGIVVRSRRLQRRRLHRLLGSRPVLAGRPATDTPIGG